MNYAELVYLIVLFPLIGFIINGLIGHKLPEKVSGLIGSLASTFSFILTFLIFLEYTGTHKSSQVNLFDWVVAGKLHATIGFQVDALSLVMALVVTGVGSLIHFYSIGYMHGEKGFARYFAYLNLFMFSMLNLVLGNNLLLLFLGWEGVGLCSYLLIGYYYETGFAPDAGKKAFIVNRIGDFGFLIGIFLIIQNFGTINFAELKAAVHGSSISGDIMFWIALMLFVGATGKSAQIPLYVWLPDAMAGPTPVSALIHAATMVTSGVYMIARLNFVYVLAPDAMEIVAIVGALTAFFAATVGLQQMDIKKVLAYSTVSQLGYMFIAVGVGAFTAGVFHLMTHAFFKALLFLGSGSVIHALHHEQDMRNMGGLRSKLPVTFWTFLMGTLAIAGTPLFSGFFSKDEILWKAYNQNVFVWGLGAAAALMTSFYMFRLLFLTFFGKMRYHEHGHHKVHESPAIMTVPLAILAILSVIGGFIGIPHIIDILHIGNKFEHFLEPVVHDVTKITAGHSTEMLLMVFSISLAVIGFFGAYYIFYKKQSVPGSDNSILGFKKVLYNKYYVDEFYQQTVIQGTLGLAVGLWRFVDKMIIDGVVNGIGLFVRTLSQAGRVIQTGMVHDYMLSMIIGVSVLAIYILTLFI